MDFPGKNKMLRYIVSSYEKKGSGLLVLYGEAGLGKTSLLKEIAMRYEHAFYYQAVPASKRQQAAFLAKAMFPEKEFEDTYPSYEDVFRKYAFETRQKQILMFDEFDHIMKNGDQFLEQVMKLINKDYTEQDFLIVLCSSSLGFVANSMGRKMGQAAYMIQGLLKMKEYSYSDIRNLCKAESRELSFYRYALMGGRPAAICRSLSYGSLKDMILHMYLDREGMFYDYGIRYISENLREPNIYATILYMIANGHGKLNELYCDTGFSRAKISVYLKNLIELDLVEKVYSYGAVARDDSKKGMYRIINPMIHFWYRFIYANRNALEFMETEKFYHTYIEKQIDSYMEYYYAKVAAQLMCENRIQGLPLVRKCDEWIGKSGDIPIIALIDPNTARTDELRKTETEMPETWHENTILPVFTNRSTAITEKTFDHYRFCIAKAGLSCNYMLVFSERNIENIENTEFEQGRVRMMSVFENIVE